MDLPPGLIHTVAKTRLFTDAQDYVILHISPEQLQEALALLADIKRPFVSFVHDKNEVTLLLPEDIWRDYRPMLPVLDEASGYRLITFDLPLDLGLVGYLAILTGVLAEKGISIFAISAFSRDHILVSQDDFDQAWDALWAFIRVCQEQENNFAV